MAAQEQPDFMEMEVSMGNIGRSSMELATNLGKMRNIPALDAGGQILVELRAMGRRLDHIEQRLDRIEQRLDRIEGRFDRIEGRFDSIEYNSIARHTNGHVNHSTTPLTPLRDSSDQEVANFPADLAALVNMNAGEVNQLLQAYGLPVVGNIGSRRNQLKKFIGVVMTWG